MQVTRLGFHVTRVAASLALAALWLVSCAPAAEDEFIDAQPHAITVNDHQPVNEALFFSRGTWGALPFDKDDKFGTLARAVSQGSLEKLEASLAYRVSQEPTEPEVKVTGFKALYEADGQGSAPHIQAGYRVELEVPAGAARGQILRLRLERTDSGASRSFLLELR